MILYMYLLEVGVSSTLSLFKQVYIYFYACDYPYQGRDRGAVMGVLSPASSLIKDPCN